VPLFAFTSAVSQAPDRQNHSVAGMSTALVHTLRGQLQCSLAPQTYYKSGDSGALHVLWWMCADAWWCCCTTAAGVQVNCIPQHGRRQLPCTPVSQTLQTSSPAPWVSRPQAWACCPCPARLQAHTRMPGETHQAHHQTHGSGTCCCRCQATAAAVSDQKVKAVSG
jgi:hypothetical protein